MLQINGKNVAEMMINGKKVKEAQLNGKMVYSSFPHIPASIDFNTTVGDNTLHLRPQTGGFDCTVYWGDGQSTAVPPDGGNIIHNYAAAGVYNIQIKGKSFAGFRVDNQTGKEKYVAAYSMGRWAVDTMTLCDRSFYGCSNLATIGDDLFRYNTAVTSFGSLFSGCTSLTTIQTNLFQYNTAVTSFNRCFSDCNKLTLRNDIFGTDYASRFNGKTVDFSNCFNRDSFSGTRGTAPEIWRFTGLTATKTSCFGGAGNSPTSLSNYASIPADWK